MNLFGFVIVQRLPEKADTNHRVATVLTLKSDTSLIKLLWEPKDIAWFHHYNQETSI